MNETKSALREIVQLNIDEIRYAVIAGVERMFDVIANKRPNMYGEDDTLAWQRHAEGAMAEFAVAKYLDVSWNPHHGSMDQPDLVKGDTVIEVRSTYRKRGHLLLKPTDPDDAIFILVIGIRGRYRLAGWILANDAKTSYYWGDKAENGRACYWIPQADLNRMRDLT